MHPKLIAPCGMNCALCWAYLREKNTCPGCMAIDTHIPITRVRCKIKKCAIIKKNKWGRCSTKCEEFPCERLESLDKRYRTKYGMSMVDNLKNIEKNGIKRFIEAEKKRWIRGDKVFCVHTKKLCKIA